MTRGSPKRFRNLLQSFTSSHLGDFVRGCDECHGDTRIREAILRSEDVIGRYSSYFSWVVLLMVKEQLIDSFGRVHNYLRISVTDRCNLRCVYCMPAEGLEFEPEDRHLTNDEITEIVRVLAELGVTKIRLTGGEPLVRKHIEELIAQISAVPGISDISMTTNGIFLAKKAASLKQAGLNRINISLDSMVPERFALITRGGDVRQVQRGIEACIREGIGPIKINVVLLKGINDDEIAPFLRWTLEQPVCIRFIEYMPIGHQDGFWRDRYLPLSTVLEQCAAQGWRIRPIEKVSGNGPAQYYSIDGARGSFGLIHPISDHFCETCNRLRLTADGHIKPCLYWNEEFNIRKWIGNEKKLKELFFRALDSKPRTHEMAQALMQQNQSNVPTVRRMSQIGG